MPKYPTELTTSEWLDALLAMQSRDEQIAALATFHRRIEYASKVSTLKALPIPENDDELAAKIQAHADKIVKDLPTPEDYASGVDGPKSQSSPVIGSEA